MQLDNLIMLDAISRLIIGNKLQITCYLIFMHPTQTFNGIR